SYDDNDESSEKTPEPEIESKTPSVRTVPGGKKISVFFMSTIGPGEKKQKMVIDTGNIVGSIKQTVGNLFGLDPADFHLSSGGVTLEESSPLLDYNITDGDDILLIPASTAG
ncbi:hypothetical protein LCGC14_1872440, partial [marine sediment metagenome]